MLKNNRICIGLVVVGIFVCMLFLLFGIILKCLYYFERNLGGDIMVNKKRNPYSFNIKKNDKPLPVMSKEQVKEALTSVEKYIVKKTI